MCGTAGLDCTAANTEAREDGLHEMNTGREITT